MESFLEVFDNTLKKLNRELHEEELEFLQWMYDRYEKEQKQGHQHTY